MTKKDKMDYIRMAEELLYPRIVVECIRNSNNENDICRILQTARNGRFDLLERRLNEVSH